MKVRIKNVLKYLWFIIIPILSVLICMALKIAQGEKNEEIVFGVMLGIVLDFFFSVVLLFMNRKSNK